MMAIGSGAVIFSWHNDSGFWIISEVAGISQLETFESYSAVATIMSVTELLTVFVLQLLVPLA